jgi:hypothetical protein
MAKFGDYFYKEYADGTSGERVLSTSNVDIPFYQALADGIEELEVTSGEFVCLARFFGAELHEGNVIKGIKLKVIKE